MSDLAQDKKTIAVYNVHAKDFAEKFMDLKLYKDSIEKFTNLLLSKSRVLDVGCGPGNVAKYLVESKKNLSIIGVDYSKEMVKIATENVPAAKFLVSDARKLDFPDNSFEVIIAAFVAPYFNSEELAKFIHSSSKMLSSNGLIYLSCMEGKKSGYEKTSFSKDMELFVNYHSREKIKEAFLANGFLIVHFQEQPYPEPDGTITTDLVFFAKKK